MAWLAGCFDAVIALIVSVWDKAKEFVVLLWDTGYGLICDFLGYTGDYIKDILNGLYNWFVEWFIPWLVSQIGSFEYTYSVLTGAVDVLVWTNYFFPVRELSMFLVWFVPFAFALYLVCLVVKIVIAVIP